MRRPVRDFALRLVVIAAILLTLGRVYATTLVTPILPALAWVVEASGGLFRVDRIEIVNRPTNTVIQLKVSPLRPLTVGNQLLLPDAKLFFEPSTLVGSVLQPIIVFVAILLAWPAIGLWALPMRLLLAVPASVVLFTTNVPLGLVGAMLDYRSYFPDAPVHPLAYWNDFLQTGGPLVMAIAAAIMAVSAADRLMHLLAVRHLPVEPVG
jgi:hypothetical protein